MQLTTLPFQLGTSEIDVGSRLRDIRKLRGHTIRSLAEKSSLNANTLSLIENGKTSPSVGTLQQLAQALDVPITAFFQAEAQDKQIVFQKNGLRSGVNFSYGSVEDLAAGLDTDGAQPLVITLNPKAGSGDNPIVHTGSELVFCLEGRLTYTVDGQQFELEAGDSLVFHAYLPHHWKNTGKTRARALLILCPTDDRDRPSERHFLVGKV